MKFCKDCKFMLEAPYLVPLTGKSITHSIETVKSICLKVENIKYDPVNGYIKNTSELPSCKELRTDEPNTIYPRCSYEGKWFEPKGEIKS